MTAQRPPPHLLPGTFPSQPRQPVSVVTALPVPGGPPSLPSSGFSPLPRPTPPPGLPLCPSFLGPLADTKRKQGGAPTRGLPVHGRSWGSGSAAEGLFISTPTRTPGSQLTT